VDKDWTVDDKDLPKKYKSIAIEEIIHDTLKKTSQTL
jgi:hypothetical protein